MSFILGKARVTPLKFITIPRLELTAAVLAVRVDKMIKSELQLQLEMSCFWTDSSTVLKYINNEHKRFRTFVANRISVIRGASEPAQWQYIHTSQNPADSTSRGLTVQKLLSSKTWLSGPEFLWKEEEIWIPCKVPSVIDEGDPEINGQISVNAISVQNSTATCQLITYYSDWKRLKTAIAWLLKVREALLQLSHKRKQLSLVSSPDTHYINQEMMKARDSMKQSLSVEDLLKAEDAIIKFCQRETFADEIHTLMAGIPVKKNSYLYKLNPTFTKDGVLRVGGRLSRAKQAPSYPDKRPPCVHVNSQTHTQANRTWWEKLYPLQAQRKVLDHSCKCSCKKSVIKLCFLQTS